MSRTTVSKNRGSLTLTTALPQLVVHMFKDSGILAWPVSPADHSLGIILNLILVARTWANWENKV